MSEEINRLITKLEKLHIQRSKLVTELATVDDEISTTLEALIVRKRALKSSERKHTKPSSQAEARYSTGVILLKGDIVETVTVGKYQEVKSKVCLINGDKVTIQYLQSKKETWCKAKNLSKVSN